MFTVKDLRAAGLTKDQIGDVMLAWDVRRRAQDAERQRRRRERCHDNNVTSVTNEENQHCHDNNATSVTNEENQHCHDNNVTRVTSVTVQADQHCHAKNVTSGNTSDSIEDSSLLSFLESENQDLREGKENKRERKEGKSPEKGREPKTTRSIGKHLLPEDWIPKPAHYAKGSQQYVDETAEIMRQWAKSDAKRKADWDATFHGFLRRNKESGNGTRNGFIGRIIDANGDEVAPGHNGFHNGREVREFDRRPGEDLGDLARRMAERAREYERERGITRPDELFRKFADSRGDH